MQKTPATPPATLVPTQRDLERLIALHQNAELDLEAMQEPAALYGKAPYVAVWDSHASGGKSGQTCAMLRRIDFPREGNPPVSYRYGCAVAALLLRCCCAVAALLLRCCCAVAALLLCLIREALFCVGSSKSSLSLFLLLQYYASI
jgi:hypothetical protein